MGALVYGSSGWFLAHTDMIQFTHAATWVPLMFLGADTAALRRGPRGPALLAAAYVLSFLGGMPQITVLGLFAAGMACAWRLVVVSRADGLGVAARGCGRAFAGVILGVLLSAVQLLPTLEIRADSARARMPLAEMHALAGSKVELVEVVMPGVLGDATGMDGMLRGEDGDGVQAFRQDLNASGFHLSTATEVTGVGNGFPERVMYTGMIPLILAMTALLARPDGRTGLALLLGAVGGFAMMGTPLLDLLYNVPAFQFANPRRFVFLVVLGLSLAAALGTGRLFHTRRAGRYLAVTAVPAVLTGALWLMATMKPGVVVEALTGRGMDDVQSPWVARWLSMHSGRAFLLLLAAAATVWMASRLRTRYAMTLMLAVLAADLTWFNQRINPGQVAPGDLFPPTGIIQWLQEQRGDPAEAPRGDARGLSRVVRYKNPATDFPGTSGHVPPLAPNLNMLFEIPDLQGFEAITDRHVEELVELVEPGVTMQHHLLRELRTPQSLTSPILDLAGVRYVLSPAAQLPGCERAPIPEALLMGEQMAVHLRPRALPRFQTPDRIQVVADEDAVKAVLSAADFDPRRTAVLLRQDADALGLKVTDADGSWRRDGEGAVTELVSYRPATVRVRYTASVDTPLLIADTFHPGWSAEIDGREEPLVRADHAFRMVLLPAGEGTLRMTFMPRTLLVGAAISCLAALALAMWGIMWWRSGSDSNA